MVNEIEFSQIHFKTSHHQKGIVLITSLVFLIALTAIAAALMQNSTTDMKMSGASEEKMVAIQEAISAIDEVIFRQINSGAGHNVFILSIDNFPMEVTDSLVKTNSNDDTTAYIFVSNPMSLVSDCPHSTEASSKNFVICHYLRIQVRKKYGRNKTSQIEVNAGIAQQIIKPSQASMKNNETVFTLKTMRTYLYVSEE